MKVSERLAIVVTMLLALGAGTAVVVPLERQRIDDPVEKARRGEVTGLHELSMLRGENATRALELVRARVPSEVRVQTLYVSPHNTRWTVVEPGTGRQFDFEVDLGFNVTAEEPEDASSDYGDTFSKLDMTVPERMAREILEQLDRPESDLDYAVASFSSTGQPHTWLLYLKGGRIRDRGWHAEADGSNVRRLGE